MLIRFGVDPQLRQDRLQLGGIGCQEVHGGQVLAPRPPHRLAVDRDVFEGSSAEPNLDPFADQLLKDSDINPAEDATESRLAGGLVSGAVPGSLPELATEGVAELDDATPRGDAREHGHNRQGQDGGQGVPAALRPCDSP